MTTKYTVLQTDQYNRLAVVGFVNDKNEFDNLIKNIINTDLNIHSYEYKSPSNYSDGPEGYYLTSFIGIYYELSKKYISIGKGFLNLFNNISYKTSIITKWELIENKIYNDNNNKINENINKAMSEKS